MISKEYAYDFSTSIVKDIATTSLVKIWLDFSTFTTFICSADYDASKAITRPISGTSCTGKSA